MKNINDNLAKYLKKKSVRHTIKDEVVTQTKERSEAAKKLLENKEFQFLIDFLKSNKQYILELIAKNDLKDVSETIKNGPIKRTFRISREEQYFENAGKYKFIGSILNFIQQTSSEYDILLDNISKGLVVTETKDDSTNN
jgi:hypothetical protein